MSTLIAYTTKYGAAKKCAEMLAEKLAEKAEIVNLSDRNPDLAKYDKVILGGSIYAGQIQKKMKEFCAANVDKLKAKKLGLYISCMSTGDEAQTVLKNSYPEELSSAAAAKDYLGGEFNFEKMNFLFKFMIKKIAKTDKSQANYVQENIDRFADQMNKA